MVLKQHCRVFCTQRLMVTSTPVLQFFFTKLLEVLIFFLQLISCYFLCYFFPSTLMSALTKFCVYTGTIFCTVSVPSHSFQIYVLLSPSLYYWLLPLHIKASKIAYPETEFLLHQKT